MRWRMLDKVLSIDPWRTAAGRKLVSLEEYSVLEPLGRAGVLPEALLVESCVELLRRFVAKSSGFEYSCVLNEIILCKFHTEAQMGESIDLKLELLSRDGMRCSARFEVCGGRGGKLAELSLEVELCPLSEHYDPGLIAETWR